MPGRLFPDQSALAEICRRHYTRRLSPPPVARLETLLPED